MTETEEQSQDLPVDEESTESSNLPSLSGVIGADLSDDRGKTPQDVPVDGQLAGEDTQSNSTVDEQLAGEIVSGDDQLSGDEQSSDRESSQIALPPWVTRRGHTIKPPAHLRDYHM